ncbi:high affinity cGMP-specific 3',5'-cyclic phosphodiesterase 9A isoform X3 [Eurytemora carolleeae]|uniref:high affinity cGMP-specific 3',5'-cyclic phosphodiesterase 9A isoform X3 n=1 Tax=Eurytemora carolleeae TaxID=1294199 RepID=UPI000C7817F6|nr:high affinity cGMP-specific 3',5'-cyclic phosphodiesterase 9A isoform X3 [Eurytemora carolleeae]|eukprot:XP_023347642.1 high affinity cGMP-specific 3',5'-cyclic phosphodiesterase 9A-like isoform X3 [Eurytemora affinis]
MAGPSDVPDIQKYSLSEGTKLALKTLQFDIWQWEPDKIIFLLEEMYIDLGLMEEFNIPEETMKRFLLRVKDSYRDVPFHNFRHSFCVTQMMYVLIHGCKLNTVFTKLDLMILITTCICHDLDHPGFDNYYQINAKTELAKRYKDLSPLENHHCSVMFNILSNPDTNIFINLSQDLFIQVRAEMMILILGTDMSRHADIVANFIQV